LLLLLWAIPAFALEITLPKEVAVKSGRLIKIVAVTDSKTPIKWFCNDTAVDLIPSESGKYAIFSSTLPGVYSVMAYTADAGGATDPAICSVTVGTPPPPGPTPGPPPPPPPPVPPPTPAPIPAAGFRTLIVYDATKLTTMPAAQQSILYSAAIRDYLNTHAVIGEDGRTKDWRVWDQGVDTSADSKLWQDTMKRPRASAPWLIVSNGTTGFEGPLPANVADTLVILKKYGGGTGGN
jgi:hypothetical protein